MNTLQPIDALPAKVYLPPKVGTDWLDEWGQV